MTGHIISEREIGGYRVQVDETLGHLWVEHDGTITWDELQQIKNAVWGDEARAVEAYPPQSLLVNNKTIRHLWRLGAHDFCPDLRGEGAASDTLQARYERAWAGA
ncbi:hypothetical protein [Pseudophaeobacter sp.]|uniref:DUF7694 domain-containing protein n=1 Tax=Pseudophaeobacter sp. TaxID=1971739 RepID=UPI003296E9D9